MIAGIVDRALIATKPAPRCADCRELLEVGQVVVTFTQGPKVYVHPHLFVHARHFAEVLAEFPTDDDLLDAEAAAVVAEYRATGRTAVDVLLDA